ncbi:hypothetical protein SETIT_4G269700v2 [Setaria italica]|uniref:DUF295 domain-containing protein n=1 Tax=Setaria italica TaxID=4555 RepID=A0A368QYQ0_SETIT|nr:hypothetical protein SETIT_4G269700v2 [Setaria italica]
MRTAEQLAEPPPPSPTQPPRTRPACRGRLVLSSPAVSAYQSPTERVLSESESATGRKGAQKATMKRLRIATAGGSGWSTLPGDLLEQISSRLSTDADRLHVRQVCAHWRACTSPLAALRPWIVARAGPLPTSGHPAYSAWLPRRLRQQRMVGVRAAPAGLPHCRGASRGWLALVDDIRSPTRLVLWDPVSGSEVPLPCLSRVTQVFLSGDPLGSPDWIAVASQRVSTLGTKLFFWRPGDAAWSSLFEQPTAGVPSVVFHGGRMFYMDLRQLIAAYDLNLGAPNRRPASAGMSYFGPKVDKLCRCERLVHLVREVLMVSCDGELLLVVLRGATGSRGVSSACSSFAEVYKLDWTPKGTPKIGERVTDLGEYSLFLGLSESFALSAKEFPAVRRNHIYCVARHWIYYIYYQNPYHKLSDWAFVFDLGSDTLKGIPYPEELRDDGAKWWPYYWLCLRSPLTKKQQN